MQIAFSNSLFSHLTLNSIYTALLQLQSVLAPNGVFMPLSSNLERGRLAQSILVTNGVVNLKHTPTKTLITIHYHY